MQTAARSYADGGPVAATPVDATSLAVAPDGSVVFYDATTDQIRRVDSDDQEVSVVAGSGQTTDGGIDTTDPGSGGSLVGNATTMSTGATRKSNGRLSFVGVLSPRRAADVELERYVDGHWQAVVSALSSASSGRFHMSYRPRAGRSLFRCYVGASNVLLAGTSVTRTVITAR